MADAGPADTPPTTMTNQHGSEKGEVFAVLIAIPH